MKPRYDRIPIFVLVAAFVLITGCATLQPVNRSANSGASEASGISIERIHPTAGGQMLDLRYRVMDREKARAALNYRAQLYIIDQATGTRLEVPNMPKVGKLRQLPENAEDSRVYWMFFGNPGGTVKPGYRVTVVINEFRFEDVVVQ